MPDQPTWIPKIPAIVEILEKPGAPPFLDRTAVETLFGLRRRQAIALLHRLQAQRVGTGLVVERAILLRFLQNPLSRAAYQDEQHRSTRLAAGLGQARLDLERRRISIPTPYDPDGIDFAGLPPGIHLQRQQLIVAFDTPTELLEKLFALGKALMNDYESFEAALQQAQA